MSPFAACPSTLMLRDGAPDRSLQVAETMPQPWGDKSVAVIIPAHNSAELITTVVQQVRAQTSAARNVEILVVDDDSVDGTADLARRAGARVCRSTIARNPAAARNLGAQNTTGEILVFLDADCVPASGWLEALLRRHAEGYDAVGGSLDLPTGLPWTARADYYGAWYHVHSGREPGEVAQHPPGNLSVTREAFEATGGFLERQPVAYAHEELEWQDELLRAGGRMMFEPAAVVHHFNRPGLANLLRLNYRWGFSALEAKASVSNTRLSMLYRWPVLVLLVMLFAWPVTSLYITSQWARAGRWEAVLFAPLTLLGRLAYTAGFVIGGAAVVSHATPRERRPTWE